jgi:acetylornithine deacetylase
VTWAARLLDHLDGHAADMVADLAALVRLPSVSGTAEENTIQDVLGTRLAGDGLDVDAWPIPLAETLAAADFPGVEVDRAEAWGTVGRLPGTGDGASLMLNAHVDVVPPGDLEPWGGQAPFSGAVAADAVYGRGACDMKAGLVAALWTVRACAALKVPLRGDLLLGTVVGEEDGGLGTYAMLRRGWRADACVIPEPTSLDLAPGTSGALTFRLTVRGRATHASRRTSGVSAIEKFIPVFVALRRLEAQRNQVKHPIMERWDLPIPIELRANPVEVRWWGGQFAPGLTSSDAAIIGTVGRAHAAVSGRQQARWGTPYGSDLRLMTNLSGVPTVHYGPGDASLAHAPRESVPIPELLTAARALTLVALEHCGVG